MVQRREQDGPAGTAARKLGARRTSWSSSHALRPGRGVTHLLARGVRPVPAPGLAGPVPGVGARWPRARAGSGGGLRRWHFCERSRHARRCLRFQTVVNCAHVPCLPDTLAVPHKHPQFRLLSQRLGGGCVSAGWVTARCPRASPGVVWQGAAGSAGSRHCLLRSTRCPCHSFPERTVQPPLNSWQNRGPSCLLPATVLDAGGASSVRPHVFPLGAKRGSPTQTELEGLSQQCSALLATGEVWGGH